MDSAASLSSSPSNAPSLASIRENEIETPSITSNKSDSLDGDQSPSPPPTAVLTEDDSFSLDDVGLGEVGFLFDGQAATTQRKLEWPQKSIQILVSVIDDEPGAVQSGHYLWPAANLLVDYWVDHCDLHQPQLILELGAGCALASLAAMQLWRTVKSVIITDHDPGALERARCNYESSLASILDQSLTEDQLNAAINDLASTPVHFELLEFGQSECETILSILMEDIPQGPWQFDWIVGTDIVYCDSVVSPIFATVDRLLTSSGVFWLSQSFSYDESTEREIDIMCDRYGLARSILLDGGQNRIQVFQRRPKVQPTSEVRDLSASESSVASET